MNYEEVEVIALTRQLVQIESTNKGTFEKKIGDFVYQWLSTNTKAEIHREEFLPERYNIIGRIKGKESAPNLAYFAHMDTVPAGSGWSKDPFKGEIDGERLYGRGALDMKAGLASAMIAFREIDRECQEKGILPKHDFLFVATGDEEDVMLGVDKVVENRWVTKDSWVLDLEPSAAFAKGMNIKEYEKSAFAVMAHKGKTWFTITMKGQSAHSSMPYKGVNAIVAMARVIDEIEERIALIPSDPVLGPATVCYGTIHGGTNTNMVADECVLSIDIRLSPPLTAENSIKLVEDAIAAAEDYVKGAKGSYHVFSKRPYVEQNEHSYLLKMLNESAKKIAGKEVQLLPFTGYTDSAVVAGSTGCDNAMSYGIDGDGLHQVDEYALCDSILESTDVVIDLARRILF